VAAAGGYDGGETVHLTHRFAIVVTSGNPYMYCIVFEIGVKP
jgi:hypothetical protein